MASFTLGQLLETVAGTQRAEELKLGIPLHSPGRLGGRLMADVKFTQVGFDWEQGRLILETNEPLIALEGWQAEAISAEAKKVQSPAGYALYKENQRLLKLLKENGIDPTK